MPDKAGQSTSQENQSLESTPVVLLSSVTQSVVSKGVFNPIDRALYLALVYHRRFLTMPNFTNPFQGCRQAMLLSCISPYYLAQDEGRRLMAPYLNPKSFSADLCVGSFAGTINAIVRHPIDGVKYVAWGNNEAKIGQTFIAMCKFNPLSFSAGFYSTLCRDNFFGITYEITRAGLKHLHQHYSPSSVNHAKQDLSLVDFAYNTIAGFLATIAASPFNYTRNIQLHYLRQMLDGQIPRQAVPKPKALLSTLNQESKKGNSGFLNRAAFFSRHFTINAASLRVAAGTAFSQFTYTKAKEIYSELLSEAPKKKAGLIEGPRR